jgi:hypothetical protein
MRARILDLDGERDGAAAGPEIARGLWLKRRTPFVYSDAPERARSEIASFVAVAAILVVLATAFFGAV